MLESIQDVDPRFIWELSKDDRGLAGYVGRARDAEMAAVADKAGYSKTAGLHVNWMNDMLGVAAEIAWVRLNGYHPMDTSVITLFEPKGSRGKNKPDVFGRDEIRRVEHFGTPPKLKAKDRDSGALVISALVEHICDPDTHTVEMTGRVYFLEWQDAAADWGKTHLLESGLRYCTPYNRRTMDTFPLMGVSVR